MELNKLHSFQGNYEYAPLESDLQSLIMSEILLGFLNEKKERFLNPTRKDIIYGMEDLADKEKIPGIIMGHTSLRTQPIEKVKPKTNLYTLFILTMPLLTYYVNWSWRDSAGTTLPKRIKKIIFQYYSVKLSDSISAQIGSLAKDYIVDNKTYYFDLVNKFNWVSGEFGDYGSCYFSSGGRRGALQMMEKLQHFQAIRFFKQYPIPSEILEVDHDSTDPRYFNYLFYLYAFWKSVHSIENIYTEEVSEITGQKYIYNINELAKKEVGLEEGPRPLCKYEIHYKKNGLMPIIYKAYGLNEHKITISVMTLLAFAADSYQEFLDMINSGINISDFKSKEKENHLPNRIYLRKTVLDNISNYWIHNNDGPREDQYNSLHLLSLGKLRSFMDNFLMIISFYANGIDYNIFTVNDKVNTKKLVNNLYKYMFLPSKGSYEFIRTSEIHSESSSTIIIPFVRYVDERYFYVGQARTFILKLPTAVIEKHFKLKAQPNEPFYLLYNSYGIPLYKVASMFALLTGTVIKRLNTTWDESKYSSVLYINEDIYAVTSPYLSSQLSDNLSFDKVLSQVELYNESLKTTNSAVQVNLAPIGQLDLDLERLDNIPDLGYLEDDAYPNYTSAYFENHL